MNDSFGSQQDNKNRFRWAVLFIFIAALSIFAVLTASKSFSMETLRLLLAHSNPLFIILAVAAMLGFILFEGLALRTLVRSFGHECSVKDSFTFSAADIYFSAITPSATGGQPASAYVMIKRGIPSSCTTVSLVFNLSLYTVAILIIGAVTMIFMPEVYMFFRPAARILIAIGAIILILMALLFVLISLKHSFINTLGRIVIALGCKLKIIKNRMKWDIRLERWITEYMFYSRQIGGHWGAILKALGLNILQRLCQLSVTMFMYIAVNFNTFPGPKTAVFNNGVHLLGAQSLISIGSTFIPIPGAMGFTDLMMLDGFRSIMSEAEAAGLELLSRFVSFYSCVIICFIITMIAFLKKKKKDEEI